MNNNLTDRIKTIRVSNAVSVGTADANSSIIDMSGYEGVRFIVAYGTITDGPPAVKVQQGAAANLSDAADLTGTSVAVADSDDNKLAIVDVYAPQERYVRCVVVRGGATGCVIDGIVAEVYGARVEPVTQDSTVAAAEKHVSPAEGTA